MNKFKLLLLGLIISILSVGSFSNAWKEEFTYSRGDSLVIGQVCNFPSNSIVERRCNANPNGGGGSFGAVYVSGLLPVSSSSLCNDSDFPYLSTVNSVVYNGNSSLTCYSETNVMPISILSPVITGLSDSIIEFIPYVVYIGLGVLGVIFGFFAIKRLINWVRRQSLGVFSSRKKK